MAHYRRVEPILALRAAVEQGNETALALQDHLNRERLYSTPTDGRLWREAIQAGIISSRQAIILRRRNAANLTLELMGIEERIVAGHPPFGERYQAHRQALGNFITVVRNYLDSP